MYKVYCGSLLLYHSKLENLKIYNPSVELEINKTGSFQFTIYPDHPHYSVIKKLKSIITVYQDDYLLFRGRALNDEIGWNNQKVVSCEGDLSFLLDSIQRPHTFTGTAADYLVQIINRHNSQVETEKRFTIGTVTAQGTFSVEVKDYTNSLETIQKQLLEATGGYLRTRQANGINYIDYLSEFNVLAPQKITFGKNLLDLKRSRKGEDIATALIPLGKDDLTIASVNNGLDYIQDADAVAQYGFIVKSVKFDSIEEASELLQRGQAYLADVVNLMETIDLSAADLATVDSTVESFHIGTQVQVTSNPHGINQRFLVSKLSINLLDPASNKLTLGKTVSTFTETALNIQTQKGEPGSKGDKGDKGDRGDSFAANLIRNGFCEFLDNRNFEGATFDGGDKPEDWMGGSLIFAGFRVFSKDRVPYIKGKDYDLSYWYKKVDGDNQRQMYFSIQPYDALGQEIAFKNITWMEGTTTTLSKPLNNGDTAVHLTSLQNWNVTTTFPYQKGLIFWNYKDANGYEYGHETYSRNCFNALYTDNAAVDKTANTITLDKAWTGGSFPAGTPVSQCSDGSTFVYAGVMNNILPDEWTRFEMVLKSDFDKRLLYAKELTFGWIYTGTTNGVKCAGMYFAPYQAKKDTIDNLTEKTRNSPIVSSTAPTDTERLWLDASADPPLMKRYDATVAAWVVVNDTSEIVYNLERNFESSIIQAEQNIRAVVAENYYLKDQTEALVSSVSTELTQTKNSFDIQFTQFNANIESIANNTDAEFEEIKKYIRFIDGRILLGEVGNELELQIANDRISFLQDGAEVAYFSDRKLHVTDGEYTNSLKLGKFAIIPRANGNLSFKKVVD